MYSFADLSEGLQPYFGSVESCAFVSSSRLVSHGGIVLGILGFFLLAGCKKKKLEVLKLKNYAALAGLVFSGSLPAASRAWVTSSSDAPLFTSILSCRGMTWFMLTLRRFTPVIFFGPVTKTKLL